MPLKNFYCSIVDLQCCVSGVQQRGSVLYIYTRTHTSIKKKEKLNEKAYGQK